MTKPRGRPHPFERDDDLSCEYVTSDRLGVGGRAWCRRCGLPGEPGDERHPITAQPLYPPTPPDVVDAELRRLGERPDVDDLVDALPAQRPAPRRAIEERTAAR